MVRKALLGEIFVSLPRTSTVQEYSLDLSMDQHCLKGRGVYCQQEGGMGPHLINLYLHVKYKSTDDQVRSISSMCMIYYSYAYLCDKQMLILVSLFSFVGEIWHICWSLQNRNRCHHASCSF